MSIKKLASLFTTINEENEFKIYINEVKKNEERKTAEFNNQTNYVNPASYRLGVRIKPERKFSGFDKNEYCPL
jgi:hypothetical protein